MILQLRGTSGSGKSHIVRGVLAEMRQKVKHREPGRRQPIGYTGLFGGGVLGVPGHYETPCGGCDTIPDLTKVFSTVSDAARGCRHVLFEGLLASEDTRRTLELHEALKAHNRAPMQELRIIHILTPIDQCLEGIQARRDARGDTRPLNPANTTNRVRTITRACEKLKEAGLAVYATDRDGAAKLVREWLK